VDSKNGDTTKQVAVFRAIEDKLKALAMETIPVQSTNAAWKGKPGKVEDEFPRLLKEGKEYTKDGVSGKYDPSFTLSIKTPAEATLSAMAADIAAYEPPAADKISKGYSDSIEAYVGALRRSPPFTWALKVLRAGTDGGWEPVSNEVLLEKRSITAQVMFSLDSIMVKPIKVLSLQMPVRQLMLVETASSKRRLDDVDLEALWKPAKVAAVAAPAAAEEEDEY
jgi:hypothetical protein